MDPNEAREKCVRLTRAQHHLLDARSRLNEAGERRLAEAVDQILRQLNPIQEKAFDASGDPRP